MAETRTGLHSIDAAPSRTQSNDRAGPPPPSKIPAIVSFDRAELTAILTVYGRKVAAGEWRDYALDFLKERAVFSVFARNSERPLFMVEKTPKLRNKQGQYMVSNQQGRILKRGHDLPQVLRVLEPLSLVR